MLQILYLDAIDDIYAQLQKNIHENVNKNPFGSHN